jgi:hypothetical protein
VHRTAVCAIRTGRKRGSAAATGSSGGDRGVGGNEVKGEAVLEVNLAPGEGWGGWAVAVAATPRLGDYRGKAGSGRKCGPMNKQKQIFLSWH